MKITGLSAQKKSKGVNVSIDGEYAFSIKHSNTITEKGLYKDKQIDEQEIIDILITDVGNIFKERTIVLISKRLRSEFEIKRYLSKGLAKYFSKYSHYFGENSDNYKNKLIEEVIDYLKNKNYIDDNKFAKFWIENRIISNKRSLNSIRSELFQKGVQNDIINKLIDNIDSQVELETCKKIAEKKWQKINEPDEFKKKQKLFTYLSSKGFSWDTIQESIRHLCIT